MKEQNKEALENLEYPGKVIKKSGNPISECLMDHNNPGYPGKILKISGNPVSERILDHKNRVYPGKVLQKKMNSGNKNHPMEL